MKIIVFSEGTICEMANSTADFHLAHGARMATPAEVSVYLRGLAEDDARIEQVEVMSGDRIDGYDRDNLGESADY